MTDTIRESRAQRLWRDCLYRIATGKWKPGHRLPPVREAAVRWGVDRRTILDAYGRLERSGLVRRANRSGYFVSGDSALDRVSRHRHELARLHDEVAERVRQEMGLLPVAAMRYLAQLASIRATDQPECGFVECTALQAAAHAGEVEARLGVPCCGVTLQALGGRARRVPAHVHTLLVSAFHADEVVELAEQLGLRSVTVPIEVSPTLAEDIPERASRVVLLEAGDGHAHDISADVARALPELDVSWRPCDDVGVALNELLAESERSIALLSPRVWGDVSPSTRAHPRVRQVEFRVHDSAWPAIADAIGLPLGEVG